MKKHLGMKAIHYYEQFNNLLSAETTFEKYSSKEILRQSDAASC